MIGGRLDITEHEQAELAARRNRQRLELLTETSQVGVWFCDLPFNELIWDHRVKEHFWLSADARVTIDVFYERLHPEDRERTRAALDEALANKSRYEIDYRTVAPDGRAKWIRAIGHPQYDADGRPVRFDGVTIDVTQQKEAEEAIRQRTAQFEALLNGAPLGVYLVDADFKIRQVNPIARPTFGDIPDLIGCDFAEVMHRLWQKDYADEVVALFRHTLETGEPYATPQRTEKRRDLGVTEYYEWQINRLPLPDGRNGVVCYFRDISVRVAAEQKLLDSKVEVERQRRLYDTILSNTPDLAYVFDLNHRFTYANDVLLRMWGKTWDEAIGKNCLELGYEPWHAEMHDREIEEVVATRQPVRGEVPFAGTFGRRIYDYILVPVLDANGKVEAVAGTTRDVTDRKNSELALRASEERYRSLFESIDEGFCVIEVLFNEHQKPVDYLFHDVNPAFEKQAGMHGATGRRMLEFVSYIEPHWLENYGRVAMTGEPIRFAEEYKGLGRWFDVYAFRVGEAHERKVAVLFNNITERKLSEIALRDSEERARAASVAKDNFLAQLSHELRTPLTPVLMTAAAMQDDPSISAAAREAFAMIERNVALEARLIDDLLDLTRVTRGKLTLRTETCDLHSLLRQAAEIVRDEMREKQISLSMDLSAPYTQGRGDPARLQQVFWNLLRNAVNFTPRGGRITLISRGEPAGNESDSERFICIEVTDSGVGFDAAHAEHLFEPFYQGHGSESTGLGLGLAIARGLVELHQGTIRGSSEGVGRGATFTVRLPVSESAPAENVDAAGPCVSGADPQPCPSMRLLVVEDHEATMRVLTTLLTREGHIVTGVGSISAALQAAAAQVFDAVVSDLGLPDGTGIELMEQLRDRHQLTGVALSGYGMESDLHRSKAAGFATHLVKPVNFEELRRALRGLGTRANRV